MGAIETKGNLFVASHVTSRSGPKRLSQPQSYDEFLLVRFALVPVVHDIICVNVSCFMFGGSLLGGGGGRPQATNGFKFDAVVLLPQDEVALYLVLICYCCLFEKYMRDGHVCSSDGCTRSCSYLFIYFTHRPYLMCNTENENQAVTYVRVLLVWPLGRCLRDENLAWS